MTIIKMKINLLSEHVTFSPGDILKGSVNVNVTEQVMIRRITVSLLGMGVVKCMPRDQQQQRLHCRKETYIKDERFLYCSKERNLQDLYTEVGSHNFPFTFVFPENIPSSFESAEGYIRYTVSSSLEGHNLPLITEQCHISVNAVTDLNSIPKAQYPSTAVLVKKKNKWFCLAKTILNANVHSTRRGYVPGEVITLNAEISNLDSKPVVSVKAQLLQITKYYHKTWPRKIKRTVAEITRGYILPNESQLWMDEALVIPPVVCSYLEHCNLMQVKYKIYFRVAKAGMPEVVVKMPIIIGNVPLMGCIDVLSDPADCDSQSVATLERGSVHHELCYFGPHDVTEPDNKDSREICQFSPKYTVYSS